MVESDPLEVVRRLAECQTPWLIGVRHHSAALARTMPTWLSQFQPEAVLLEMPPEFARWLPFLGADDLETPIALAACDAARLISFYPMADFSPELACIRWAAAHGVPVIPCDLELSDLNRLDRHADSPNSKPDQPDALAELLRRFEARDSGDLWERLVETPACTASPEAVRRAALLFGWLVRNSSGGPTSVDAHREHAMRRAIANAPRRSVAVVGAFHAAALLPDPLLLPPSETLTNATVEPSTGEPIATSLIPYSFSQLDQRSGYPAGILDPVWHQTMLSTDSPSAVEHRLTEFAVELCRRLREAGHVASTPDATEIVRLAHDLARLRGHGAPGRGELLEAIESSLVQGDLYGRGRAVANAAQRVFIGVRRGRLPKGAPRSGLALQIEDAVERLKLPGPSSMGDEPRELRLDPLRSRLDRGRAVFLRRLQFLGVPYGERFDTEAIGDRENLTEAWRVQWRGATTASIESVGLHGATLAQACQAFVRRLRAAEGASEDDPELQLPSTTLLQLKAAAECGLATMTSELLERISHRFADQASTTQLIAAASLVQRIVAGHVAGLPRNEEDAAPPDVAPFCVSEEQANVAPLIEAALRSLPGLSGSTNLDDVVALVELAALIGGTGEQESPHLPAFRSQLEHLQREGSPVMQGAAWGVSALISSISRESLDAVTGSWYDVATTHDGRRQLRTRFQGLLIPLASLIFADPLWLGGLEQRLSATTDDEFLQRLPALRGGFRVLTPADRTRFLHERLATLEPRQSARMSARIDDPEALARGVAADRAGRAAIASLLPDLLLRTPGRSDIQAESKPVREPPGEMSLAERWRLILGVQGERHAKSIRAAKSLDQLYGPSIRRDRGDREDLADRGGSEDASPAPREWLEVVTDLFGEDVCLEVAAEAATNGRAALLEHLNPETVRPSVDLLEKVLSLKGALPEHLVAHLRKLARRITEQLAQQLANRLRPALSGLSIARPTRRRSRRLDFARTLAANLDTAHRRQDGRIALAPRRVIFRTPVRRQMDWHVIFVVDVSGSMEASVIYSALVASILAALPAIDVRFFAFSTSVIDLSKTVDDPLSLLMEVQVGGGTHIGLGLRAAREAVKNPSRTIVVLVSDFEEGVSLGEMLAETKMLADSGVRLLGLAALGDDAKPRFHAGNAAAIAAAGMAVAAVSPERLAQWIGDQIRGAGT